MSELPSSWVEAPVSEIAAINPPRPETPVGDDDLVSFVPMASVQEESGVLDATQLRPWREVNKGYTKFQEGDVLFAKITPCMENGKFALAEKLHDGVAAGSTEFHVLRPTALVRAKYLLNFLLTSAVRRDARMIMKGAAGQLRVPSSFFDQLNLPIAPPPEQDRIVAEIEKQFTRLDAATAALKRVQANLKRYRASVLKAACEGRLVPTEAELARKEGRDYEPANQLLKRILRERRARWEADTLAKMTASGKPPSDDRWKQKYKEPAGPDAANLPALPEGWCWANFDQIAWRVRSGTAETSGRDSTDYPVLKSSALRPGTIDFEDVNYLKPEQIKEDNYVQKGDLLVTRLSRSLEYVAQSAVVENEPPRPVQYPDRLFCAKLVDCVSRNFVSYMFRYSPLRAAMEKAAKSTAGHQRISMTDLFSFLFPLPPASEQERLVSVLDRQYSFVDRLNFTSDKGCKRAERLRQSVLVGAFSGTLVEQDPADEPASVLLERIRAERAVNAKPPVRRKQEEPVHA